MRSNVLLFLCNQCDDRSSTRENPFLLPATILTATMKGRWIKGRDCQTLNPTRCKGLAVCARMEILSENSANTVNAPTCCRQPRAPRNRRDPGLEELGSAFSSRTRLLTFQNSRVTRFVSTSGDTRKPQ